MKQENRFTKSGKEGINYYLATWRPGTQSHQSGNDLLAHVESGAVDFQLVDLLKRNKCQDADDDLLFLFDLAEGMIKGVQLGGRVQGQELQVRTKKLVRRPEAGQVVVTNQESGDHDEATKENL